MAEYKIRLIKKTRLDGSITYTTLAGSAEVVFIAPDDNKAVEIFEEHKKRFKEWGSISKEEVIAGSTWVGE